MTDYQDRSMANKLVKFFKTRRYVLAWFWEDAIKPYRWAILKINLLELSAVATEIAAYGVIVVFINALQSEGSIKIWKYNIPLPVSDNMLLWYTTTAATFFFVATAFIKYFSKKATFQLAKHYDKFCTLRLIQALRDSPNGISQAPSYPVKKAIIKDARICGSMLKAAASFIIPSIKIVGSIIFMFYTNLWITFLIVGLLLFTFYFLHQLGAKTMRETQIKERLLPLHIKQVIQSLNHSEVRGKPHVHRYHTMFHDETTDTFYNALYNVRILATRNLLIIQLCIAVTTFLILMIVGNFVIFSHIQWDVLITFIIAMQIFFRNLHGLAGIAKQISSKIDYVIQYHKILQLASTSQVGNGISVTEKELSLQLDDDEDDDFDDL